MTREGNTKVLRVGLEAGISTLDPAQAQDLVTALAVRQVFDQPYAVAADQRTVTGRIFEDLLHPEPAAEDPLVYSAAVRSGIRFSDGVALEAGHVVEALSKALHQHATSVVADGDRVSLRLKRPNCRFELTLTHTFYSISREESGVLLGTGPYYCPAGESPEELGESQTLRLVRNPYYEGPVGFDEILFTTYPPAKDGSNRELVRAIGAGEVDFTSAVPRQEAERLRGVRTRIEPGNSTAILFFNTERLPDKVVRKSLALAINRQEVAEAFYPKNALAFTAASLLPRVMGAHQDGLSYDLHKALALLAEAEASLPRRLRLLLIWGPRPYLTQPQRAAEKIARYLERLGVEVEIVIPTSSADYYEKVVAAEHDLLLAGWIADTPDPAEFLEANLSSDLVPEPGKVPITSTNHSRWRNDAADQALACYRGDPSESCKAEILRLVAEEVPLFPLMYGPTIFVHSRRVAGFQPSVFGVQNLAELQLAP
jgi:ABC-type transport system substrate-binding protein